MFSSSPSHRYLHVHTGAWASAAAAKSLQSCPTLCDPIDGRPPGSAVPGILQARTLESVAISFSNAWKWKVKVKSLSRVRLLATPWTAAHQAPPSMGFSRQEYWRGVPLPSPEPVLHASKVQLQGPTTSDAAEGENGDCLRQKSPSPATGSHNISEACPTHVVCQPQSLRPSVGHPLGEQLHCLCCSIRASVFKVNTMTPSNHARQAVSAHISNFFSQPKLFLKDGSVWILFKAIKLKVAILYQADKSCWV